MAPAVRSGYSGGGSSPSSQKATAEEVADDEAMQAMADQLTSWDHNTRKFGLQALGLQGPAAEDHVPEIAKLLRDEEWEVRKAAAAALGKIGFKAAGEAAELGLALKDEDPSVRAEAAKALSLVGRVAALRQVERVAALAKEQEEDVAMAAVACLSSLGEATRLVAFLGSPRASVVRAALVEIGRCPEARGQHREQIAAALLHADAAVRLAACQASGELGADCSEEHLKRIAALQTSEKQVKVRRSAVQALGRAGEAGAAHLLVFLRDRDEEVRHFAADTLAACGGKTAAGKTAELLDDPDPGVRRAALMALGRMRENGRDEADAVATCLYDNDMGARLAAIQALSDLAAEDQASALGALCEDATKGVRQGAVGALAKLGCSGAEEALRFFDDTDPSVRQSAVKVFSPLHSKLPAEIARRHIKHVGRALLDEDWRVRLAAAVALGDLHASELCEQVAALSGDPDTQVRRSAVTALEKMGASAALAARFLGDGDAGVRQDAQKVFAALGGGKCADDDDGELSECD
eukprot:TRINITY_DN31204_c0_g1_i1.p1 TRINITY_DN31204_c0_g1~~TRINITY_DN31204_c0_g1_i1.p1  ORF type:complete len:549 (-),score=126.10 TRINITY_DN31204_c0_g1_i1:66-1637(-)